MRIKVAEDVSKDIRENKNTKVTQKIFDLANKFDVDWFVLLTLFVITVGD